ncbi:ribonuclease domain-containing protein [Tsukamurella sp. 1534]|uniref:ribonuclease domain-containing protein n=1 Tax=Tsukamurella sp. 1534 TaxID=1151061 RepID=UPI0002FD038E|nr:ribonuclease domain-containing protein [Tsukamurella sp. 1534]
MRRILALCAITLLACLGLVACGKSSTGAAAPGTSGAVASTASAAQGSSSSKAAPARIAATLKRIDAGTWPPDDGSGTQGGRNFGNFEGRLLKSGSDGKRVKYTEWDVNIKKPGRGRDAERIVTGSDGSAWYTLDHYETFTRIR